MEAVASLAVAALDLKVVELVLGAIRIADLTAAASAGGGSGPAAVYEPRVHVHPEPRYEDRQIVHPEPRYKDRPIFHSSPRFALPRLALQHVESCDAPETKHAGKSPVAPVWAALPRCETASRRIQVKVIQHRTDIHTKGSLIDVFM